jgi:tetratricopeptide (TPR) repeat protein
MKRALFFGATLALLLAAPVAAQDRAAETQALREAGTLEARGQARDAVLVLERLLQTHPVSPGALLALDRLMRTQGRASELLAHVDRFLAIDADEPAVVYLKLKLLAEADSSEALERVTEQWIERAPDDMDRYRQAAPLWERAFGRPKALELLRDGRDESGSENALAAEIGDLLLRSGQPAEAAVEWARAVRADPEEAPQVTRRIQLMPPDARTAFVDVIVAALETPPSGVEQRLLAVQIALLGKQAERALAIAERLAPDLDRATHKAFMEELARWGETANAPEVTVWALAALRDQVTVGAETQQLETRIADVALASGDTAAAVVAGGRLAAMAPFGSAERRRLVVNQMRLEVQSADPEALQESLFKFRQEFRDAPETDELAAAVSSALQRAGDLDAAEFVISDVDGPRSALERAYLLLARGDMELGAEALVTAAGGLIPARATEAIQLASLLGKVTERSRKAVAAAAVSAHNGADRPAALELETASATLPEGDRAAVLAHAARLAESAQAPDVAARIRGAIVANHPDAVETAEAALLLARWHALRPAGVPTAVKLLEELILRSPASAIIPDARRELARLRGTPTRGGV